IDSSTPLFRTESIPRRPRAGESRPAALFGGCKNRRPSTPVPLASGHLCRSMQPAKTYGARWVRSLPTAPASRWSVEGRRVAGGAASPPGCERPPPPPTTKIPPPTGGVQLCELSGHLGRLLAGVLV